jgi:hypothetical protein
MVSILFTITIIDQLLLTLFQSIISPHIVDQRQRKVGQVLLRLGREFSLEMLKQLRVQEQSNFLA